MLWSRQKAQVAEAILHNSPVAQSEDLAMSPYKQFSAFLIGTCPLEIESGGCELHTGLAFSKSKMADKMAAKILEMP